MKVIILRKEDQVIRRRIRADPQLRHGCTRKGCLWNVLNPLFVLIVWACVGPRKKDSFFLLWNEISKVLFVNFHLKNFIMWPITALAMQWWCYIILESMEVQFVLK